MTTTRRAWANDNPATSPKRDYTTRQIFDQFDPQWRTPLPPHNEGGQLGWGRAWLLQAYILMYRAYRDPHYLDQLIEDFDGMLKLRDSVRGVTDFRGLSLPAWRCISDYTCGSVILKDAQARPTLQLRSAVRPASACSVIVSAGTRPNTFKLIIHKTPPVTRKNPTPPKPSTDIFDNLTMDPASADFAPLRINADFARLNGSKSGPSAMITAKDVRPSPDAACDPVVSVETIKFQPLGYVYAVQTGQITYPIAAFIRLVNESPELKSIAKYRGKAAEYLDAIIAATDIFDYEWREKGDLGWYVWAKGCPIPFDGCDQAHNQYLSLGRTLIHLAAIAPDAAARDKYRDRAIRMARTFKSDLKPAKNDAYSWSYFWSKGWGYRGWKASNDVSEYQPTFVSGKPGEPGGHTETEDVSHAQIDIEFAELAYRNNLGVFDASDMQRLASTLARNILTRDEHNNLAVFDHVDGIGKKGTYDIVAAGWAPLAAYDRSIFSSLREIYDTKQPDVGASSLPLGIAYLNAIARVS